MSVLNISVAKLPTPRTGIIYPSNPRISSKYIKLRSKIATDASMATGSNSPQPLPSPQQQLLQPNQLLSGGQLSLAARPQSSRSASDRSVLAKASQSETPEHCGNKERIGSATIRRRRKSNLNEAKTALAIETVVKKTKTRRKGDFPDSLSALSAQQCQSSIIPRWNTTITAGANNDSDKDSNSIAQYNDKCDDDGDDDSVEIETVSFELSLSPKISAYSQFQTEDEFVLAFKNQATAAICAWTENEDDAIFNGIYGISANTVAAGLGISATQNTLADKLSSLSTASDSGSIDEEEVCVSTLVFRKPNIDIVNYSAKNEINNLNSL
ncbi:hypothetical protein HK100_003338, partial [Physocladia obscura]